MSNIIPDPDFEGFDGVYAGGINVEPPTDKYNYTDMVRYMSEVGKNFQELTTEELEQFRTQ